MTATEKERLIKRVVFAFVAQVLLTSAHHIYGGLVYDSAIRLSMPIFAAAELLIVLGLLTWYRRRGSGVALGFFSIIASLVGVVQGLFHILYGHLYKDILFAMGITADRVRDYFAPVIPNDFVYPPSNLFFEATGLLQLAPTYLIAIYTYRLVQNWRLEQRMHSF